MNPFLPAEFFVPDGEAHVMPDGRLYLYGSLDIRDGGDYCSDSYRVFSTDDMQNWVDHGVSFSTPGGTLYAPDCLCREGKYYLYYCTPDWGEYTAVSDSPYGPFTDPQPLGNAGKTGIDPAVFLDDDGTGYIFWGQFSLKGARLDDTLRAVEPNSVTDGILTEAEHGFHEGASIRKINGLYYLVFTDISRGKASCLSYAVSPSPLGPYTKRGVIIDNALCDPGSWNNHGSIEQFGGRWYVFYHRSSRNGKFSRRACCERIEIDGRGNIAEVQMTSQGAQDALNPFEFTPARSACKVSGEAYICTDGDGGEKLVMRGKKEKAGAEFKYFAFTKKPVSVTVTASGRGRISMLDESGEEIAQINVSSDVFTDFSSECSLFEGTHALSFVTDGSVQIKKFKFC